MGFSAFPIPKRSKIKGISKKVNPTKISRLVNRRQQENAHDNNKFDVRQHASNIQKWDCTQSKVSIFRKTGAIQLEENLYYFKPSSDDIVLAKVKEEKARGHSNITRFDLQKDLCYDQYLLYIIICSSSSAQQDL